MKKVHITSLGCAKNLVDSEVLGGQLKRRDYILTSNPSDAELIIVNTCGFIEEAKKESIQAIFEAIEFKKEDKAKQVFVTGCLSERYKDELTNEIPAIDAIFGTEDYERILNHLGENNFHPEDMYKMRDLTTPRHFAYLKISEGCNHSCAFCAIPNIRGKHRSRSIEDILAEAKILADQGIKELILVSQDTSYYGKDIYKKPMIVDLISKIANEKMFTWIRPLYWYPSNFPKKFIHLMNKYESIVPYLDMPIQHASDHVLGLMRRAEKKASLVGLYRQIKKIKPDIALRTTFILGHPGETNDDFEELKDFVELIRFDRVGAFVYSDEEGTGAYDLNNKVDKDTAQKRHAELMTIQTRISEEKNNTLLDTVQNVLIDGYDKNQKYYHGRTYRDAPEIDNEVIILDSKYISERIGTLVSVQITDVSEHELYGHFNVNL
jgi:ribosomal protein S12 methylthiotransferase